MCVRGHVYDSWISDGLILCQYMRCVCRLADRSLFAACLSGREHERVVCMEIGQGLFKDILPIGSLSWCNSLWLRVCLRVRSWLSRAISARGQHPNPHSKAWGIFFLELNSHCTTTCRCTCSMHVNHQGRK